MIKYNEIKKSFEGKIKSIDGERWISICHEIGKDAVAPTMEDIRMLQVRVYVMCGGGMLGDFAMRQPADFYIDLRVGRLPYPNKKIYQAVEILRGLALYLDLDPTKLPEPNLKNWWIS